MNFSFWFDPWMEGYGIIDLFPSLNLKDTDIRKNTTIKEVWRYDRWNLPEPLDNITLQAWNEVKKVTLENNGNGRISWS